MTSNEQAVPDNRSVAASVRRFASTPSTRRKMLAIGMIVLTVFSVSFMADRGKKEHFFLGSVNESKTISSVPEVDRHLKAVDRDLQVTDDQRKLVWLISFPESGTTYVMHLFHTISNRATATNFGTVMIDDNGNNYRVISDSIPVFPGRDGPSFSNIMPSPDKYILTRTHGHGTCSECPPWKYLGPSASLMHSNTNRFGTRMVDGQLQQYEYSIDLLSKLLVLVRDPLDNVAARFFVEVQRKINAGDLEYAEKYPKNRIGFQRYCEDLDSGPYFDMELNWYSKYGFWEEAKFVPCRSEFVKIFSFYNNIRKVAIKFQLEMKTVTLKSFATNMDDTVNDVFNYLQLPRVNPAPENILGDGEGVFGTFYTDDDRTAIAKLGQKMAMGPAVWEGFAPYLDKYLD